MALVRKKVSTVKWPVTINLPADGGKWEKETFTGVFKVCSRSQIEELANTGDPELIQGVMEGWEGIEEEDGTEIPFNSKNLSEWIDNPHWLRGTVKAILQILDESAAKN